MIQKPGRLFEVTAADFPIEITIEARNLQACQAFVSDTVITVDGDQAGTMPVSVIGNGMKKSYQIPLPAQSPCNAVSVINGYFADSAPDTAKYVIAIAAANGDSARTTMSRPALNPGVAALVFHLS
jgi:hypothetical protein